MSGTNRVNNDSKADTLRALTWNVRGLNDHRKLRKVLAYLKRKEIDIALLQETHLPTDSPMLRSKGLIDNIHAAGFTTNARGVLTLINPRSPYTFAPLDTDKDGRFVITRCKGKGLDLLVVNIYGPNYDCPEFFTSLANSAGKHGVDHQLWGGVLNLVRNPTLDRSDGPARRITAAATALEAAALRLDLHDVWRKRHSERGDFTHYSSYHNLHTRIDY